MIETSPIELREITVDNFEAVIALEVAEDQRNFLYSNVEALAWAYVAAESNPLVIYAAGVPVGFATYGYVPTDGRCWVSHFMVGAAFQQRGIGLAALEQLLVHMTAVSGGANIAVAVSPDNAVAIRLYERCRFVDTGRRQNGEMILLRKDDTERG